MDKPKPNLEMFFFDPSTPRGKTESPAPQTPEIRTGDRVRRRSGKRTHAVGVVDRVFTRPTWRGEGSSYRAARVRWGRTRSTIRVADLVRVDTEPAR